MKKKEIKEKIKRLLYSFADSFLGEDGRKIINVIYNKKNVNEFLVAQKTRLNINQVRNIFYKLESKNLVSSIRKKDRRKGKYGWYIYFWTLYEDKALEELKKMKLKRVEIIEHEIKNRKEMTFFECKNKCVVMREETALLHDFFCPECGELLMPSSMDEEIKKLEDEKNKIKKEIEEIDKVLEIYRRMKKEEVERKEKREREKKMKERKMKKKIKKRKKEKRKKKK
jgi:transcription initiation factor TFIIE subunit alpha